MNFVSRQKTKSKVVIVGIYMPGIYPAAEDDVVARLLAPSFLKAVADADSEVVAKYDIEIIDIQTTEGIEDIAARIVAAEPDVLAYSVYMWNYDQVADSLFRLHVELRSGC